MVSEKIDWEAYHNRAADIVDFSPSTDRSEMDRCKAAWSVMPRGRIKSLLDCGCGDGYFCHWIKKRLKIDRVVGLDFSERRLARARERYPEIEFISAELNTLPFDDGEFDMSTCIEVLEHLENPEGVLNEIGRVSKRVVLTVPDRQAVREVLCPHCLKSFPASAHLHFFDKERIGCMAASADLQLQKVRSYYANLFENRHFSLRLLGACVSRPARFLLTGKGLYLAAQMARARLS